MGGEEKFRCCTCLFLDSRRHRGIEDACHSEGEENSKSVKKLTARNKERGDIVHTAFHSELAAILLTHAQR